jgi:hypothetical protein
MRGLLKRPDFTERVLLVSILFLLMLVIAQHFLRYGPSFNR